MSNTFALSSSSSAILANNCPYTRRDTDDGHQVRAVVLDELDTRVLWLPQLQVAIDGRHGDEVRAVFLPNCLSFRE